MQAFKRARDPAQDGGSKDPPEAKRGRAPEVDRGVTVVGPEQPREPFP